MRAAHVWRRLPQLPGQGHRAIGLIVTELTMRGGLDEGQAGGGLHVQTGQCPPKSLTESGECNHLDQFLPWNHLGFTP